MKCIYVKAQIVFAIVGPNRPAKNELNVVSSALLRNSAPMHITHDEVLDEDEIAINNGCQAFQDR